jgi:hypothetical protein|tara:strand:+ start:16134 stop:16313 length:180 start_codon:yes stop_codon:yes gene_type:complete
LKTERPDLRIREEIPGDIEELHSLIRQLADYENLAHTVTSTPTDLREASSVSLPGRKPS